ncbi:MAG: hypothetical protein M3Z87_19380, partial [Lactobacillus sp.]|nr:hypothetical protein [Lactobacillus sp.]
CYVVYAHFSSSRNQNNNTTGDVSVSSDNGKRHQKVKKPKKKSVKIKELAANQFQITGLKNNRNLVVRAGDQATTVSIAMNGVNQSGQTLTAGQKHTLRIPETAQTVVVTFSNAIGTSVTIGGKKVPYNSQNSNLTLTFYIGKRHNSQTQSGQNNSGTTNYNSEHSNSNHQNQSHNQTGGHSNNNNNNTNDNNHSSSTNSQENNQNNNQSNQNGQSGHDGNQSNNNDHSSESGHSGSNSSSGNESNER